MINKERDERKRGRPANPDRYIRTLDVLPTDILIGILTCFRSVVLQ